MDEKPLKQELSEQYPEHHMMFDAPEYSDKKLTDRQRDTMEKIDKFVDKVVKESRLVFHAALDEQPVLSPPFREELVRHLVVNQLDMPSFKLRFGDDAQKMLREVGLDGRINQVAGESGVLLIQLPKPLAQFWRKGKGQFKFNKDDPESVDLGEDIIPWGTIYQKVLPVVWEARDKSPEETGLYFQRINKVAEHDPEQYYYVWLLDG